MKISSQSTCLPRWNGFGVPREFLLELERWGLDKSMNKGKGGSVCSTRDGGKEKAELQQIVCCKPRVESGGFDLEETSYRCNLKLAYLPPLLDWRSILKFKRMLYVLLSLLL